VTTMYNGDTVTARITYNDFRSNAVKVDLAVDYRGEVHLVYEGEDNTFSDADGSLGDYNDILYLKWNPIGNNGPTAKFSRLTWYIPTVFPLTEEIPL